MERNNLIQASGSNSGIVYENSTQTNQNQLSNQSNPQDLQEKNLNSQIMPLKQAMQYTKIQLQAKQEQPQQYSENIQMNNQLNNQNQVSRNVNEKNLAQSSIQVSQEKVEYTSRELFSADSFYIRYQKQIKQNELIHSNELKSLQESSISPLILKQAQLKAFGYIFEKYMKNNLNDIGHNPIKIVDKMYKKYILKPKKELSNFNQQYTYDIYKPDPIFCETLHYLKSQKTYSQDERSQNSQFNNYKRPSSSVGYGQNFVSLVQTQSTNQPVEDLETIANSFVSTIRKTKTGSPQGPDPYSSNKLFMSRMKKPQLMPSRDNSMHQLLSQIKMPSNLVNKQFQPYNNTIQSHDEERSQRFNQERLIAKTFVKDGYGLSIVRNYMGPSIQGGGYNRAVTTIIRQSYKKIEQFLSKQCHIKIHSMTSAQFSLVKTPLVHCRNILRPQDLRTFFKFIAITYNFGKLKQVDYPTAQQTLDLYNAIIRGLNDRKSAKESILKTGIPKQLHMKQY